MRRRVRGFRLGQIFPAAHAGCLGQPCCPTLILPGTANLTWPVTGMIGGSGKMPPARADESLPLFRIQQLPMSVEFSQIPVAVILGLRHRLLRPGLPASTAEFAGDDQPGTLHFGAKLNCDVVSCLSLYTSEWQGSSAWQLRGMATDAALQGQGIGRGLLEYAVAEAVARQPSWSIWCNARISAIGFYSKVNWTVESEKFEIEGVGPHVRMLWSRP